MCLGLGCFLANLDLRGSDLAAPRVKFFVRIALAGLIPRGLPDADCLPALPRSNAF
jgi:hypothetical protein